MTNEEAIAIIRNEYKCVDRDCDIERSCGKCDLMMPNKELILEAYKLAIKALEQQPCEDVISREAVIEWLKAKDIIKLSPQEETARKELKALPSVTPQQKYGKWIGHREHCENLGVIPSGLGAYEWCSNCDCGIDVREWHRNHYNYCPNCGAKMQESEEV